MARQDVRLFLFSLQMEGNCICICILLWILNISILSGSNCSFTLFVVLAMVLIFIYISHGSISFNFGLSTIHTNILNIKCKFVHLNTAYKSLRYQATSISLNSICGYIFSVIKLAKNFLSSNFLTFYAANSVVNAIWVTLQISAKNRKKK